MNGRVISGRISRLDGCHFVKLGKAVFNGPIMANVVGPATRIEIDGWIRNAVMIVSSCDLRVMGMPADHNVPAVLSAVVEGFDTNLFDASQEGLAAAFGAH